MVPHRPCYCQHPTFELKLDDVDNSSHCGDSEAILKAKNWLIGGRILGSMLRGRQFSCKRSCRNH